MNLIPYTLFVAIFCVGCSRHEETAQSAKPGETKTFETLSATQTTGASVVGKTSAATAPQILRAVRTGNQPGMDRIVFEFNETGLPEWEVKYVEQPLLIDCGSGDAVLVAGNAWLQITFRGAQAHTEAGEPTSDPRRRELNQPVLRELVRTCDFEGQVTWVVGVIGEKEYTPRVLAAPSRLVIDVAH
ncbi:MAG: AMIN-like domain-containing (lipo)protein [Arenimonas sp.]